MTDSELESDLVEGLSSSQIARKRLVSRQYVNRRRKQLLVSEEARAHAAAGPEKDADEADLDAQEELLLCVRRLKLLSNAYHEWLLDADDPTRYDVGPRAREVHVTYWKAGPDNTVKARAPLSELLQRLDNAGVLTIRDETRVEDPRSGLRATIKAIAGVIKAMTELARMLSDAHEMNLFRVTLLEEISKVDENVARTIAEALRPCLMFYADPASPVAMAAAPADRPAERPIEVS